MGLGRQVTPAGGAGWRRWCRGGTLHWRRFPATYLPATPNAVQVSVSVTAVLLQWASSFANASCAPPSDSHPGDDQPSTPPPPVGGRGQRVWWRAATASNPTASAAATSTAVTAAVLYLLLAVTLTLLLQFLSCQVSCQN